MGGTKKTRTIYNYMCTLVNRPHVACAYVSLRIKYCLVYETRLTSDAHVSSLVARWTDASHKGGVRWSHQSLSLVGLAPGALQSRTVLGRLSTQV